MVDSSVIEDNTHLPPGSLFPVDQVKSLRILFDRGLVSLEISNALALIVSQVICERIRDVVIDHGHYQSKSVRKAT